MLTLFTIPKAFAGHIKVIQDNALRSWLELGSACEIILFGDEHGTAEAARRYGVRHIPDIDVNEYGTPLVSSAFALAEEHATHPLLAYLNADIMVMTDFARAVSLASQKRKRFLLVGQRWDIDLHEPWDFEHPEWQARLRHYVAECGELHPPYGSDYFAFPRGALEALPPFAVGRAGWDNWLIYRARRLRIPVIDASAVVTVVHQGHDYAHIPEGVDIDSWRGPETDRNLAMIGGRKRLFMLVDSTHILTSDGTRLALDRRRFWRHVETAPILYPGLRVPATLLLKLRYLVRRILKQIGLQWPV